MLLCDSFKLSCTLASGSANLAVAIKPGVANTLIRAVRVSTLCALDAVVQVVQRALVNVRIALFARPSDGTCTHGRAVVVDCALAIVALDASARIGHYL